MSDADIEPGGGPAVTKSVITRTLLDYAIDALVIVSASVLLYFHVISDTQWTATVVAVSAGRAALRLPNSNGGAPPSSGATTAILLGIASLLKRAG